VTLVRLVDLAARASQAQAHDTSPGTLAASNPVDVAMLRARTRFVGESVPPVPHRLLPFSSDRKLMAVFYDGAGGTTALTKGAPSAVLPLCQGERADAAIRALDPQRRAEIVAINEEMAGRGLRVLAVASGRVDGHGARALHGLVFEGLVGIADPVADGVPATVAQLRAAGLRTVMITGDQRGTAVAVASAIGLAGPESGTMDGRELDRLGPEQLATRVAGISVFCRVSPEHKLRIVEALQRRGEIVAMLGDGINDAAALKKADVGVAMGGRGTDVAKGASAIVLQDDRFETIAAAVEEGRVIFDNIRKFVLYLFSCNVAEILVLLLASLAGLPLPVQPLQLLWLNMVTDTFPALALAVEPGDTGVMERPPRDPNQAILSRTFVTAILTYAGTITAATLAAFSWGLRSAPDQATTVAFMTLAFGQIAHLGNARSEDAVLHPVRALGNPFAVAAVALATLLQLLTTWGPLASILGVAALDARAWVVVGVCGVFPAVAGQAMKVVRRRLAPAR
jgi:Ca2+-transporting ATPase